jgi:Domain of unknown function (DUF4390)
MRLKLKFKLSSKLTPIFKIGTTQSIYLFQGFIVTSLFFLATNAASSAEARITDLIIRDSQDELLVDLKIEDYFTEEMQAVVLKGIPITISFSISFYEVLDFWFDNKLVQKKEFNSIHYDPLRKEYRIRRSWEKSGPAEEKDFLKAQKFLSGIKGLDIISLSRLKKGAVYQLWVKSELYDRYLPFSETPFDFKTDWYTINFIY